MNKKKYIKIILIILAISTAGFLGWRYFFSNPSAKKIEIQSETVENNNAATPEEIDNNTNEAKLPAVDNQDKKGTTIEKPAPTDKINIINRLVGWGYEKASGRKIDTIIIHSTYNALGGDQFSLEKILDIYKSYGVAPHYIIDRGGKIYRLVADENIAYHAGESKTPDGRMGVNNFSIGIEVINSKTEKPTDKQYTALNDLLRYLRSKYTIKYVLGHNQIAPGRKDDPWNFVWDKIKE
ncbi:MAG: N-acetylmuramoyl-L-alanine amidase [Parcubacteria group bacterium]